MAPGAFTSGTNHFAHSGSPADHEVVADYDALYPGLMEQVGNRLAELAPPDADVSAVPAAIAEIVDMPHGTRPFRRHRPGRRRGRGG